MVDVSPLAKPAALDEESSPEPHVPGSFLESLPQFFVFPLILVGTLTVLYLVLRVLVGGDPDSAADLVAQARGASGPHARWQSLYALADGLRRGTLDVGEVPSADLAALWTDYAAESPEVRQYLLLTLAAKHDPGLTVTVVSALGDPDAGVRQSAIVALSQLADPGSTSALVAHLQSGVPPEERWLVLGALKMVGTPAALDAIAGRLDSEDGLERRNAALALAAGGDARARPRLAGMLDRGRYADIAEPDVVEAFMVEACRAAAHLGGDFGPALTALRATDESLKVRSAAINALQDLESP